MTATTTVVTIAELRAQITALNANMAWNRAADRVEARSARAAARAVQAEDKKIFREFDRAMNNEFRAADVVARADAKAALQTARADAKVVNDALGALRDAALAQCRALVATLGVTRQELKALLA